MRTPRPPALLFGLLAVLLATVLGCGGTPSGQPDSAPLQDTGATRPEAGDGPADAATDHKKIGLPDASDGPSDATKEAMTKFTIGGSVSGLVGTGLVLANNGGDDLTVSASGAFTFATPLPAGAAYSVTIVSQPSSPTQVCTITGGSGTVGTTDVASILVNCTANTYTISGTVYGLAGTLVLQNNGGDDLTLLASAPFVFATPLATGAPYAVTILSAPSGQVCTVSNGTGTVAGANVTNVSVVCANPTFTIGGTVTGLTGAGLVLRDNGSDDLPVSKSGVFTFATGLPDGASYTVTIATQPSGQYCTLTAPSGTVASADVTTVKVKCAVAVAYSVGGTISGLVTADGGAPNPVVLQDNLGDDLTVSSNGSFTFATKVTQGHPYAVTVLTNPSAPTEFCSVSGGAGTVGSGPVTSVVVTCYASSAGGCGRFSNGFTGAWSTVSPNPLPSQVGFSDYLPPGGTASIYLAQSLSLESYAGTTDTYTTLTGSSLGVTSYGSLAWLAGALWTLSSGDVLSYDLTSGTWSTAATGLTTAFDTQTTADDIGNVWGYSSDSQLLQFNVATSTTTYHLLPTPLTGAAEPRIVYDSCSGLLYLTDYVATSLYSYDPASGTQTLLSSLPAGQSFQDGFCGDRSGHIFAVTNSPTVYQYTITTDTWTAMPAGGLTGNSNSTCGVGSDGYLYASDPAESTAMYRIQLN